SLALAAPLSPKARRPSVGPLIFFKICFEIGQDGGWIAACFSHLLNPARPQRLGRFAPARKLLVCERVNRMAGRLSGFYAARNPVIRPLLADFAAPFGGAMLVNHPPLRVGKAVIAGFVNGPDER